MDVLPGQELVVVWSVFLALSFKMLGSKYPGLQSKLRKTRSRHLNYFHPSRTVSTPHKASSGGSGTQENWPSSRLLQPHQDVIVPRFPTAKACLSGPAAAQDAPYPTGREAGWGCGAREPQVRSCQSPCGARAARFPAPGGGAGHARGSAARDWTVQRPGV